MACVAIPFAEWLPLCALEQRAYATKFDIEKADFRE